MTQIQLKVTQAIPFPGKLPLKGEVARLRAEAIGEDLREARLRLARDVTAVWWRIAAAKAILGVLREGEGLLQQALDVAMIKYRVGKGLQQDVLLAQVELSRIRDKERSVEGALEGERARLRALLGLSGPDCIEVRVPSKPMLPKTLGKWVLISRAMDSSPAIAAAVRRHDAASKALALAKKGLLPDFKIGAAYGVRQGRDSRGKERTDFATFTFAMTVPIWASSKQLPAIRERTQEEASARAAVEEARNRVEGAVGRFFEQYESLRDQVGLYRDRIIPSAEQTAHSMMAAYRVNKVDFLNVVRAELALLDYRIQLWKLYASGWDALAALEMEVGGPVLE